MNLNGKMAFILRYFTEFGNDPYFALFYWIRVRCRRKTIAIFEKVGRLATEDVIIQLLRTKCLPVLYYGLEACTVTTAQTKSLDYALHSCFRKIFSTRDQVVVNHCMAFFDFSFVSEAVKCKQHRFFQRYLMSTNSLCVLFCNNATAVI